MFNLGMGEILFVALAALLLIPPKELPKLATSLGRFVGELQRSFNKVKSSLEEGKDHRHDSH